MRKIIFIVGLATILSGAVSATAEEIADDTNIPMRQDDDWVYVRKVTAYYFDGSSIRSRRFELYRNRNYDTFRYGDEYVLMDTNDPIGYAVQVNRDYNPQSKHWSDRFTHYSPRSFGYYFNAEESRAEDKR